MSEKHVVTLNDDESASIKALLHKGKVAARRLQRATLLRFADTGLWRKNRATARLPNWMASKKRF